ncbi:MAG: hypothetical protein IKL80_00455 [Clostridia bacterium]|nr:hypothetical protein [Clostridia bacterium]
MVISGFVLLIIGALITFLAKPVLQKAAKNGELNMNALYIVKVIGMWIVIIGAGLIFIAGGIVDVRAVR